MATQIVTTTARLDDEAEMAEFLLPIPNGELLAGLARSRDALGRGARRTLERQSQRLVHSRERLRRAPALLVERRRAALTQAGGRLRALSPRSTLERGYAIVRREGELVRSAEAVSPGDPIAVEVADGSFGALVE